MNTSVTTLLNELKNIRILFFVAAIAVIPQKIQATILDSIGIEKKDGKLFVLHQVEAKETLFSISKKYSAKIEDIKSANKELSSELTIGQTLRIPYKGILPSASVPNSSSKIHIVEKKETLYSISKRYSIPLEVLLKSNPGADSGLKEGQELKIPVVVSSPVTTPIREVEQPIIPTKPTGKTHTVEPKETLYGISKKYDVSVDDIKKANPQLMEGLKEGMELIIPDGTTSSGETTLSKTKESPTVEQKNSTVESSTVTSNAKGDFKKITEKGTAELFDGAKDSPKFQALHKSAPIGTIIQVTNESNNQKIFVRVVGKYTSSTDPKTIIKLSQKAMDRLEVKEAKVAVVLTYIP